MADFDPVALVEKAYAPQPQSNEWLGAMAHEMMAPFDWDGHGVLVAFYKDHMVRDVFWRAAHGSALDEESVKRIFYGGAPEISIDRRKRAFAEPGVLSFVETCGKMTDGARAVSPIRLEDSPGVVVHTAEGEVVTFCTLTSSLLKTDAPMRTLWRRLAIHLGAGFRLAGRPADPDADDVDAVLEPGGELAHAESEARGRESRERLREAARRIDRARTRQGRADPMAALELWQGLMAGRWSLVEHFDSDGRRFMLARRNDPKVPAPGTLTRRQRQVVFYASLGWSLGEVGYALGLTPSTVSVHLRKALAKLEIATRAELVRIGSTICEQAASWAT